MTSTKTTKPTAGRRRRARKRPRPAPPAAVADRTDRPGGDPAPHDARTRVSPLRAFAHPNLPPALALVAMVAVAYAPAVLWGGFVWDDTIFTEAEPVRTVSGLWDIWFAPEKIRKEAHYWPLTYTIFWLEHKLWGFWAPGFHAVNVVLHIANTLLLWRLLRRVEVPGAWLVAAVFAVHPLNVNSVAWIIERKDVLSGLFYLTAALAWLRYEEKAREDARGWRHLVLSAMLLGAGLLCKSSVVTLPAALLIVQWWRHGRVSAGDLLRVAPLFAVAALVTALDLSLYLNRALHSFDYSLVERVLVAGRALWFYPVKILWPADLAVVYPLWDVRVSDLGAWTYPVAAVALAAALWCLRRRIGRGPLAGALFYAVTVSPMLGIVPFSYMAFSFVADRFQYLAGIGVTAVVIGAAGQGPRRRRGQRRLAARKGARYRCWRGDSRWSSCSRWGR